MLGRERCVPLSVASVAPQVDEFFLSLNDDARVPGSTAQNVRVSRTRSDDRAKFIHAPKWEGVFLTVDDDIIYPPGYVDALASRAAAWPEVPVGFHGSILSGLHDDYYAEGARTILRYFADVAADRTVDVIGTGTMAFVPKAIGFDADWLTQRGVTDLEFSANLRDRGIRPVVLAHSSGWIRPVPAVLRTTSLSAASRRRDAGPLDVRDVARLIVKERFM